MSRKRPQPPVKPFKKKPNPLKAAKVTEIDYKEAVAAKELIEGSVVEIAAKVSESGKLFGGISADKIAIALSSKAAVNPKNITVDPIKTTGEFAATVALHPEISASFTVKVVAE